MTNIETKVNKLQVDKDFLLAEVNRIYNSSSGQDRKLQYEDEWKGDFGADSIETYEMIYQCEEELGVRIPEEKATEFYTVEDTVNYLLSQKETIEKFLNEKNSVKLY